MREVAISAWETGRELSCGRQIRSDQCWDESFNLERDSGLRRSWSWSEFAANVARMAILFVALVVYSWFRKTYFQRPPEVAFANALDIIDLQRALGIAVTSVEIPLQQRVLEHSWLIDFFNAYYRQFKPALYICALLCMFLAPVDFRRIWRVFMIATLLAVPWYAIYPLAPPRLMEQYGFPFVDTLAVYGGAVSSSEGVGGANQFAAMPSMHIAWTTIAALWLAAALPRWRIGVVLGVIHLALMCLTVIVTANHYVLDIVAGFTVAGVAVAIARLLPTELPWLRWRTLGWGRRSAIVPAADDTGSAHSRPPVAPP